MAQTTARVKKEGKHYEILVDEDEALKLRKDEGDISQAVLTGSIFHNIKSGEHASSEDLEKHFNTTDVTEIAEKIIRQGEIVRTTNSLKGEQEQKYKQAVEFLSKNATSPEGRPYTPDRIQKALQEARVNIKNKPIDSQITDIIDELSKVLPIKIETKKIKLRIPALHTGKAYGTAKEYITKEEWMNNGDLECIVEVPSGLLMDFFDKINNQTHGSIMSEEIKN
jgi:ribosome maturation protein SDO1